MEQGRREEDHHLRRMKPPPTQSESQPHHQPPPPPPQKCPRCDSLNTKFCYYNNYSLTQPRYFCKTCRRYWTQGGTLRNVPVGGGCRKAKRTKPSGSSSAGGDNSRSQPQLSLQPPLGNLGMPPMTMSGSYYSGGGFLSSLAAMNNLSQTQPFHVGGSSSGFSLLQGFNLSSLSSQQPQNMRQNEFYQMGGQSLVQPNRPLGSWNQTPINNNGSPNSNPNAGISLEPNQLPDFPGYGPPAS